MITEDYTQLGGNAYPSGCSFINKVEAARVYLMHTFIVFIQNAEEVETWQATNASELVKALRATYRFGTQIKFCQVDYVNHSSITL